MTAILGGLLIFFMRVTDMSLDTLRMLFAVRGRKWLAGGIGVVEATVFLVAVSQVLKGPLTVPNVMGYGLGFGGGVMFGMFIEERLAIGFGMFRIYSPLHGGEIAAALRSAGFAATEIMAAGRDGSYTVVNCAVARRDQPVVQAIVDKVDRTSFVTIDPLQPLQHGFFGTSRH
jgi:uncharacterized protein YebE (UPF0316 family)